MMVRTADDDRELDPGAFDEPATIRGAWLARHEPMLGRIAAADVPILLLGETGVGKEVVADLVHRLSRRAARPLLRLNCAAMPEQLLEAELFGYVAGAFTGATRSKIGLIEAADSGTVFLDELGEMPLATQAKLLRVVEHGVLLRLGDIKERRVDVRYIAATNRDLSQRVGAGLFRSDLLYRLNTFTMWIPPLRERKDEIPALVAYLLRRVSARLERSPPRVTEQALEKLTGHDWPGNIRELKNVIERAVVLAEDLICPDHVSLSVTDVALESTLPPPPPPPVPDEPDLVDDQDEPESRVRHLRRIDRESVTDALLRCAGNQTRAAKLLGVSRRTLISRLERYDLPRPRKR